MILKNLTKVWVSSYIVANEHGEKTKSWKYKGVAYLNLQQDLNELDVNNAGVVDYSIVNARTDKKYNINKGDGISLTDVSQSNNFTPNYTVQNSPQIGSTHLYKLVKYND